LKTQPLSLISHPSLLNPYSLHLSKPSPLSSVKKLAGQTLWYGLPTIASRFLGYLMNLSLPLIFAQPATTADLTQLYALIPFLNVLFTYGLETAYFRFAQQTDRNTLYNTLSSSLLFSTLLFSAILWAFTDPLAAALGMPNHPEYIRWMIGILALDAVAALAFARLRLENRPKRYAFARLTGILINVIIVLLFLGILPTLGYDPISWIRNFHPAEESGIVYYLIGNAIGSFSTLLLLSGQFKELKLSIDLPLWKKIISYSLPLIIVGLGGIANDMMSRLIYQHVVDLPPAQARHELGVFGNIIRLSIAITIAIQAFRMAAEPFFFRESSTAEAPNTYARVMRYFVLTACILFLMISLYIDVVGWFFESIGRGEWTEGLHIVPLFAMGNIFLGIYYNLSIWYKLTDRNAWGAWITALGAAITIALNIWLIPTYHYLGAALATVSCYLVMMLLSYWGGQRFYPVPYDLKKISGYIGISILLVVCHRLLADHFSSAWLNLSVASILLAGFLLFAKKEISGVIRKNA
jgi:O-antigen/teichoic acid export membrane protein